MPLSVSGRSSTAVLTCSGAFSSAFFFQGWVDLLVPLALSGSVVGVLLNTVVPPFLLLVILSLLLLSLSVRTIVSAVRIHQSERAAAVQRPFDEVLLSNPDPSFRVSPGLSSASPSSSRAGTENH